METNFEVRTVPIKIEMRKDAKNETVLIGLAAPYNKRSGVLGGVSGFTEIIEPGFFSGVLDNDVIATVEHNPEKLVGRTKSGTLKIADTTEGLTTENTLPNTTTGNDLRCLVERGDIQGMSFKFRCKDGGSKWEQDSVTKVVTRTLMSGGCEALADITYTHDPAYSDTKIAQRSMTEFRSKKDAEKIPDETYKINLNKRKRQIKMAEL